jgi:hypothetical protein
MLSRNRDTSALAAGSSPAIGSAVRSAASFGRANVRSVRKKTLLNALTTCDAGQVFLHHFAGGDRGAVYVDEVEAPARVADELGDLDPWEALAIWLRQFVGYATTKRAVVEGLNLDSPMFGACIALIHRAGEPLLKAAQDAGKARSDVDFEDVRLLINGVASSNFTDDAQRERVIGMALDGIKRN